MVFLTITPTILEALEEIKHLNGEATKNQSGSQAEEHDFGDKHGALPDARNGTGSSQRHHDGRGSERIGNKEGRASEPVEPSLESPELGRPISHSQIIDLWKDLKARGSRPRTLDSLLKGSSVYNPPRKPKPEPTAEYKTLMARLRREEEERSYHRMTSPEPAMDTFAQRFPLSSAAHAFASSHQLIGASDPDDDEVTYADVNRQVTLILNVLVSIVACAGAIWVVAKWWSTPARLAVSLGGSLLVGVAEVVVYSGYIRRVSEAKTKEKGIKEVKEVVNTWVVGAGETADQYIPINDKERDACLKARRRKEI